MTYNFFKSIAFKLDPEFAHEKAVSFLSHFPGMAASFFDSEFDKSKYQLEVGPLRWSFPVGLAAGLDKNAACIDFFSRIGFGAVEVGTVTPLAQEGNPRPRLFRFPEEESLRNMMGFNNEGAESVYQNIIKAKKRPRVLGVNLGKNKTTHDAHSDYRKLYQKFSEISDYMVINVSSPNTPGLRDLQNEKELEELFESLLDCRKADPCPLYLKISPDLALESIPGIVELVKKNELAGIIATNTTIMKELGSGGVSGKLLYDRAKVVREKILESTLECPDLSLIGVGGFSDFSQILDYWKKGGRAVQIYSSFIYQGPQILSNIKLELDDIFRKYEFSNLEEMLCNIARVKC